MPTVDQSEFMSLCSLIEARGIMGMKRGKDTRQAKVGRRSMTMEEHCYQPPLKHQAFVLSTSCMMWIPQDNYPREMYANILSQKMTRVMQCNGDDYSCLLQATKFKNIYTKWIGLLLL